MSATQIALAYPIQFWVWKRGQQNKKSNIILFSMVLCYVLMWANKTENWATDVGYHMN